MGTDSEKAWVEGQVDQGRLLKAVNCIFLALILQ
jgi:hypothetical protein